MVTELFFPVTGFPVPVADLSTFYEVKAVVNIRTDAGCSGSGRQGLGTAPRLYADLNCGIFDDNMRPPRTARASRLPSRRRRAVIFKRRAEWRKPAITWTPALRRDLKVLHDARAAAGVSAHQYKQTYDGPTAASRPAGPRPPTGMPNRTIRTFYPYFADWKPRDPT